MLFISKFGVPFTSSSQRQLIQRFPPRSHLVTVMPPKFNADDPDTAAQIAAFRSIGLNDAKSLEVARSSKQATILASLIDRAQLREKREAGDLDEKKLALLLSLCVACAASAKLDEQSKLYALDAILRGRLKSNEQISGVVSLFYC